MCSRPDTDNWHSLTGFWTSKLNCHTPITQLQPAISIIHYLTRSSSIFKLLDWDGADTLLFSGKWGGFDGKWEKGKGGKYSADFRGTSGEWEELCERFEPGPGNSSNYDELNEIHTNMQWLPPATERIQGVPQSGQETEVFSQQDKPSETGRAGGGISVKCRVKLSDIYQEKLLKVPRLRQIFSNIRDLRDYHQKHFLPKLQETINQPSKLR